MTSSRRQVDLPSLKRGEIRDPALTAALRKLELTVRRKLDGVLHGDHLGLLLVRVPNPVNRASTSPATTCAGWTGR